MDLKPFKSIISGFKCITNGFISKSINIQIYPINPTNIHINLYPNQLISNINSIFTITWSGHSSSVISLPKGTRFTFKFLIIYFWGFFLPCFSVSWTLGSSWICLPPAGPESDPPVHPEAPGLCCATAPKIQWGVAESGIPHLPSCLVAQPHRSCCIHHRGWVPHWRWGGNSALFL